MLQILERLWTFEECHVSNLWTTFKNLCTKRRKDSVSMAGNALRKFVCPIFGYLNSFFFLNVFLWWYGYWLYILGTRLSLNNWFFFNFFFQFVYKDVKRWENLIEVTRSAIFVIVYVNSIIPLENGVVLEIRICNWHFDFVDIYINHLWWMVIQRLLENGCMATSQKSKKMKIELFFLL